MDLLSALDLQAAGGVAGENGPMKKHMRPLPVRRGSSHAENGPRVRARL